MDRRDFLAAGAALAATAVGGCTGCARLPSASLDMDAVSDREIARRATGDDPAPSSERYRFVETAIENGSATVEDTDPRLPENDSFVYDDAVYRLSYEVVDSEPATSFQFTLNPAENVDPDETIRYEGLPAVDREKLGLDGDPFLGFGSSLLYLESEIPDSMLVPEPEFSVIVWNEDTRGRFEVDGSYDTALKTYRYTAEQVNPSATAYGRRLREEYGFELSGLSDAEREIVRTGIENEHGYAVPADESPPDAVWRLAERFRPHREVRGDEDDSSVSGTYVVRYDGEVYWTRFHVNESKLTTATGGDG